MPFDELVVMMTVKSNQNGLDLTIMEQVLGLKPMQSSKSHRIKHQNNKEVK